MLCSSIQKSKPNDRHRHYIFTFVKSGQGSESDPFLHCSCDCVRIVPKRRMRFPIWPTTLPLLALPYSNGRRLSYRRAGIRLLIPPLHRLLAVHMLAPALLQNIPLLDRLVVVPGLRPTLLLPLPAHFHGLARVILLDRLVAAGLLGLVDGDETAVRTCHVGDHPAGYFGCFGGDGAGLAARVDVPPVVGVAAGGDEEGEVEESGWCG